MIKKILLLLFALLATNPGNAQCWSQIASGWFHNVAIQNDGTLWAWGRNDFGQLGDGTNTHRTTPVQIGADSDWAFADLGDYHTIAIKTDGTLWSWGQNDSGQLGNGTFTNRSTPLQIGTHTNWQTVSLGPKFTLALKSNGQLWAWGQTGSNQLGTGNSALNQNVPVQVGTAADWSEVAAGANFGLGLRASGTLWGWGDHNSAALANGMITGSTLHPTQSGTATNWAVLATGNTATLALKSDNTLWSWGGNTFGALGTGAAANDPSEIPAQVGSSTDWRFISMGRYHAYGLKSDNSLWIWGRNNSGQIGDGTTTNRFTPLEVGSGTNWLSASGGDQHTIAISSDHSLWSWGGNSYGQLGDGTNSGKLLPTPVGNPCTLTTPSTRRLPIVISPNPAEDFFIIANLPDVPNVTISIINLLGQTLAVHPNLPIHDTVEIPVKGYPRGIYIIRILSAGYDFSQKIIVR